jgi:hypothetical protein
MWETCGKTTVEMERQNREGFLVYAKYSKYWRLAKGRGIQRRTIEEARA